MTKLPPPMCTSLVTTESYEELRLQALHQYDILYTAAEEEFNILVALASTICETPIALISLVTSDKQWFKAGIGIDVKETPLSVSFCQYAVALDDILEVCDTTSDIRFFQNPYVTGDPKIRFYAGAPLVNKDGYKLGTLCVIDVQPRELTEKQRFALATLSEQVVAHLELRLKDQQLGKEKLLLEQAYKQLSEISNSPDLMIKLTQLKTLTEKMEFALVEKDMATTTSYLTLLKKQIVTLQATLEQQLLNRSISSII
ncbi:GAF domain-containing protein [Pontibacter qinzhouensis]|uniref:GAF domain-containing protein n=1 Tax=Pontibacter qinzhouensis TaxID=2603253 RepID=A0A5C8KAG9_9BACT|nr:GAF domain-containing protein [Pontibacter qinzhouensis]TXK46369.1 GAF domain-containing protein [Pontibacter qinzhouensis]